MNGDVHALSGAYAVDALDGEERAEFERHLASCDTCQDEVASLREAASLLAETTPVAPPAGLRERLLSDIGTVRPLPPTTEPPRHAAPDDQPTDRPTEKSAGSTVVVFAPRRRRRTFLAAIAAAAAVVAIGAGGLVWTQVDHDAPPSAIQQVLQADDAEQFDSRLQSGGTATVVVSDQLNQAVLETHGLPAPAAGKQYVLWLRHGSTMTPAGVLQSGTDSDVLFSGDPASANGAAVSVEDEGQAPTQPSDDVVASFSFDA